MKKILIILGILVFLFLVVIISIPLLFKAQIVELVKEEANKNIKATLDFEDIGLSLIKHFPGLTLTIEELSLVNLEPFAGDTLISLKEFQATLNLRSLVMGKQLEVVSIHLVQPRIKIKTLKDGLANWKIFAEASERTDSAETDTIPTINLSIQKYEISDGYLIYIDEAENLYAEMEGLQHRGKGDFRQTLFTLSTQTNISSLTLQRQEVAYSNHIDLGMKADLEIDLDKMKFSFKENEIRLNQLYLNFDGWAAFVGEEDILLDLNFKASRMDFKNILSMVPSIYQRDFADLKTEGRVTLEGKIQGTYNKKQVPGFDIKLDVSNGMFQYPQLPTPIRQVAVDLQITNPGKTLDHTIVNLEKLHLEILNEPITLRLLVKTPVSDPYVEVNLTGTLNLSEVQNFMPIEEGLELRGMIRSDFELKGNLSAIEKNQPDRISTAGMITLSDIEYTTPDLPVTIQVKTADLNLSPREASLENLNIIMGKSDIKGNGVLKNIPGFILDDQTLKGTLTVQSKHLDLNPWIADDSLQTEEDSLVLEAIELPDKVEFLITANFNEVIFDNLNLTDVKGKLLFKDRTLRLIDLRANLLQGSMVGNGTYSYIPPQNPHVDFNFKISQLNISEMFQTFVTMQKAAPIAGHLKGEISGKLNLKSDLNNSLIPEWESLSSQGSVDIPKASLENFEPLNKVADKLKINELHNPTLNDLHPSYRIKNGRFYLQPLSFKIDKYEITASGSNGFDKSLDYFLKIKIPASKAKANANSFISGLIKQDVNLLTDETIVVDVHIRGTFTDPKIQTSLSQIIQGTTDKVKKDAEKAVEKRKEELKKLAEEKLEQKKRELEKKKKEEENKVKKALEKKLKEEEKKLKKKLKDIFNR